MPVAFVNLVLDQYADFSQTYYWIAGGVPVNLSGATARFMARQNPSDVSPLLSLTTTPSSNGSIVLGGIAGTVALTIAKVATTSLIPAVGTVPNYDLLIDWPGGTTTDLLSGQVLVKSGNTH